MPVIFTGKQRCWGRQWFDWPIWCWFLFCFPCIWEGAMCFLFFFLYILLCLLLFEVFVTGCFVTSSWSNLIMYIICNQVVVSTKSPKSDKQYVWESEADSSSYVIKEETDPEKILRRGTEITLYLKVYLLLGYYSQITCKTCIQPYFERQYCLLMVPKQNLKFSLCWLVLCLRFGGTL